MRIEYCRLCNDAYAVRDDDDEPLDDVCPLCDTLDEMCGPVVAWVPSTDPETGYATESEASFYGRDLRWTT